MKDYSRYYRPDQLEPFFPNEFLRHIIVVCVLFIVLLVGAIFLPESSQEAVSLSEDAGRGPHPWYLLPISELSRLVPNRTAFLAILGCAGAALLSVPFWDRTDERRLWRRPVFFPVAIATLVILLALGILGRVF